MKDLRRLRRALAPRDLPAVAVAAIVALTVEVGLRTLTLPRLARLMGVRLGIEDSSPMLSPNETSPRLPDRAWRRLRAVRRVMRHWPFGDTCLRHALVSGQRLRRLQPTLQVGVAKVDGALRAHAWLEIQGVSLDPAGTATFGTLQPVPDTGSAD